MGLLPPLFLRNLREAFGIKKSERLIFYAREAIKVGTKVPIVIQVLEILESNIY